MTIEEIKGVLIDIHGYGNNLDKAWSEGFVTGISWTWNDNTNSI